MFNPEITPGPWNLIDKDDYEKVHRPEMGRIVNGTDDICYFGREDEVDNSRTNPGFPPDEDDLKAICAVPELLEVLKKVYPLISALNIMGSGHPGPDFEELIDLEEEIKKLEKRHCDV